MGRGGATLVSQSEGCYVTCVRSCLNWPIAVLVFTAVVGDGSRMCVRVSRDSNILAGGRSATATVPVINVPSVS